MGTLFEPDRKIWIVIEKVTSLGTSDIFDERGQKIGTMHQVLVGTGGKIELKEQDGTIICEIHRKMLPIGPIFEVKDKVGIILGRIKKGATPTLKTKLWMETSDNQKIFEAIGKHQGWNFVILDVLGNQVATINKLDKVKDFLPRDLSSAKQKYTLQINDASMGTVDARQLLGFVVAINGIFNV